MKRSSIKIMTAILAIGLLGGALVGCEKKEDTSSDSKAPAATEQKYTGSITATGSTALQPLADEVGKMFKTKNPDATINVQGGGSGTGLNDVSAGNADIGDSDLFAAEKLDADKANALVDNQVAVVGFAPVVNSKVNVTNLTKQQVIDIFTGKVTNWKDVGGNDLPIRILSRPDSSGTKATFKKYALDGAKEATGNALKEDASATVAAALKETDGAISYLASSYLVDPKKIDGFKVVKFDGLEMNKANITSGKYVIWSYEHMYTKGAPTGLAKGFIDFFKTKDVKAKLESLGYYSADDMKVSRTK